MDGAMMGMDERVFNCIGSCVRYKPCSSGCPFQLPLLCPIIQRKQHCTLILSFSQCNNISSSFHTHVCVHTRPEDRDVTFDTKNLLVVKVN